MIVFYIIALCMLVGAAAGGVIVAVFILRNTTLAGDLGLSIMDEADNEAWNDRIGSDPKIVV
jgi:hypothetical protein